MTSTTATESSCPEAMCPGQLSFCAFPDQHWLVCLIDQFDKDGWVVIERTDDYVIVNHRCMHRVA